MRGFCGRDVLRHVEVPYQALPRRPRQEGAAVCALAPAHAIRALVPGVPTIAGAGAGKQAKSQPGRGKGAVTALINLMTGLSSRIACRMYTVNSCRIIVLPFSPSRWIGSRPR